jgi:tellurite resistance protein
MNNKIDLRHFPIALFASVMGFAGMTLASKQAEQLFDLNHLVSTIFLVMTTLLFLINGFIIIYRLLYHKQEVHNEFQHPVKMNFFGAISIGLLLLAAAYYDISNILSFVMWLIGAGLQIGLTLAILSKLIFKHGFQILDFNAAWFIPVVGNIIIPIAGIHFLPKDINWIFFSIGIVFSIIYFMFFFDRVFFNSPVPPKLLPGFFILMAPPAVGFTSYLKLTGNVDGFAHIIYGIAFFIGLFLLMQLKRFMSIPFAMSWWAFLFPSAAMTGATVELYQHVGNPFYKWLFVIQIISLIGLAFFLVGKTIQIAIKGQLTVKGG